MSRINRVPKGLQDLLGSQNFGDNPSELGQIVAPTLDVTHFLASERRFFDYNISSGVAVDGQVHTHIVPAGEIWYVDAIAVGVAITGLGGSWQGVFGVMANNLTNVSSTANPLVPILHLGQLEPNAGAAASSGFAVFSQELPRPLAFFSNEQLIIHVANGLYSGGQTFTIRSSVRYVKTKV